MGVRCVFILLGSGQNTLRLTLIYDKKNKRNTPREEKRNRKTKNEAKVKGNNQVLKKSAKFESSKIASKASPLRRRVGPLW